MLVGQGAHGAAEEIVALADRLGAGVATSLLGSRCSTSGCRSTPVCSARSAPPRRAARGLL
ncbi:hypothetical protein V2I01_40140 [Micromonospora sp. BRA006-A]|nr:hypothetical protein [Micromonospora sp. BRA006-A]